MTNALSLYAKHFPEPMNHPKRTQEIATILCQRLGGHIELSRKIVGILKDAETEWSRDWYINRITTRPSVEFSFPLYPSRSWTRRGFPNPCRV